MSTRRDGRNLEETDELEALLLESGQQVCLDELKFCDEQPQKARELMKKWEQEQELWLAQLPELLDKIHELAGEAGVLEAGRILQERAERLAKEVAEGFAHLDAVDQQELSRELKEGVQRLEKQQNDMLTKLREKHPQIQDILQQHSLVPLLKSNAEDSETMNHVD